MLQGVRVHALALLALLTGDYDAFIGDGKVSGMATLGTAWVSKPWVQVPKLLQHFIADIYWLSDGLPAFVWRELRDIR
jgi:hypothetical protein